MNAQERFPKPEYEAEVIGVYPNDRYSFDNGGSIKFLLENGEVVFWHIPGIKTIKTDISLKTTGHYLNYSYSYGQKYYHQNLLNRHCIVLIKIVPSKKDEDRLVPIIDNFKFSYIDLFSYNGDNHE